MPKKSALLTISVWDERIRLSLIGKTLQVLDTVSFSFSIQGDDQSVRWIDPFELVYFVRTGIQQLLGRHSVLISSIGLAFMPGYLMAWDRTSCTPLSGCYLPNNSLSSFAQQEFKFSSFYSLFQMHHSAPERPNTVLNLWLLAKALGNKRSSGMMVSGVDVWLQFLMSGGAESALVSSSNMMSEFLFPDGTLDEALITCLGFDVGSFPQFSGCHDVVTNQFFPLSDGIPLTYSTSINALVSDTLSAYSKEPVALVHLSNIHHLYVHHPATGDALADLHWMRFSSWQPLLNSFGGSNGDRPMIDVTLDDIQDELVIPLDPFESFHHQTYHLLNMASFDNHHIHKLGIIQTLFLIKYMVSQCDRTSQNGHVQQLVVSVDDWNSAGFQLCVDLCQIHGVSFKLSHWLDLIHVVGHVSRGVFVSDSAKQDVFKLDQHLIPMLDPLTCYSLYQEWEHWFNKLYDNRR